MGIQRFNTTTDFDPEQDRLDIHQSSFWGVQGLGALAATSSMQLMVLSLQRMLINASFMTHLQVISITMLMVLVVQLQ